MKRITSFAPFLVLHYLSIAESHEMRQKNESIDWTKIYPDGSFLLPLDNKDHNLEKMLSALTTYLNVLSVPTDRANLPDG